jgi:hypothetical protein
LATGPLETDFHSEVSHDGVQNGSLKGFADAAALNADDSATKMKEAAN